MGARSHFVPISQLVGGFNPQTKPWKSPLAIPNCSPFYHLWSSPVFLSQNFPENWWQSQWWFGLKSTYNPYVSHRVGVRSFGVYKKKFLDPFIFPYIPNIFPTIIEIASTCFASLFQPRLKAVHFLHRVAGALHRDVKPQNFGFTQALRQDTGGFMGISLEWWMTQAIETGHRNSGFTH